MIKKLLFMVIINNCVNSQLIGEMCTAPDGNKGTCELIEKCPQFLRRVKENVQTVPHFCQAINYTYSICCVPTIPALLDTTKVNITSSISPTTIFSSIGDTTTTTTTASTTSTTSELTTTTASAFDIRLRGTKNGVGEIALRKCKEYAKYVFNFETPPILLPNSSPINMNKCTFKVVPLIIGGTAATPGEFPHMALLGFKNNETIEWKCGGTLISEQFILTAAHCLHVKDMDYVNIIRLGDLNYKSKKDETATQDFTVAQHIPHPQRNPLNRYHDIALLKMDRPAKLNPLVRPACLHTITDLQGEMAIASGWGSTSFGGEPSSQLMKVVLDIFSHSKCNSSYKYYINSKLKQGIINKSQICAGSFTGQKDACQGDSGGPLQIYNKLDLYCMYEVIGVTSFGKMCGNAKHPGVYTRVSQYIDWIEKTVWLKVAKRDDFNLARNYNTTTSSSCGFSNHIEIASITLISSFYIVCFYVSLII